MQASLAHTHVPPNVEGANRSGQAKPAPLLRWNPIVQGRGGAGESGHGSCAPAGRSIRDDSVCIYVCVGSIIASSHVGVHGRAVRLLVGGRRSM